MPTNNNTHHFDGGEHTSQKVVDPETRIAQALSGLGHIDTVIVSDADSFDKVSMIHHMVSRIRSDLEGM